MNIKPLPWHLQRSSLAATQVVLGGCSAGAMHVYSHLDAMKALVPGNATVVGLPQSGYFLDELLGCCSGTWIRGTIIGGFTKHRA